MSSTLIFGPNMKLWGMTSRGRKLCGCARRAPWSAGYRIEHRFSSRESVTDSRSSDRAASDVDVGTMLIVRASDHCGDQAIEPAAKAPQVHQRRQPIRSRPQKANRSRSNVRLQPESADAYIKVDREVPFSSAAAVEIRNSHRAAPRCCSHCHRVDIAERHRLSPHPLSLPPIAQPAS